MTTVSAMLISITKTPMTKATEYMAKTFQPLMAKLADLTMVTKGAVSRVDPLPNGVNAETHSYENTDVLISDTVNDERHDADTIGKTKSATVIAVVYTINTAHICEDEQDDKVYADVVNRHASVYGIANENVTNEINGNGEEDITHNKADTHSAQPHIHGKMIADVDGLHGSDDNNDFDDEHGKLPKPKTLTKAKTTQSSIET